HASPPRLVEYQYRPDVVGLERDELDSYDEFTRRAGVLSARLQAGDPGATADQLRLTLIQRARVLKKAHRKVPQARDTLRERYERGDRWLVYCDDNAQLASLRQELTAVGLDP